MDEHGARKWVNSAGTVRWQPYVFDKNSWWTEEYMGDIYKTWATNAKGLAGPTLYRSKRKAKRIAARRHRKISAQRLLNSYELTSESG